MKTWKTGLAVCMIVLCFLGGLSLAMAAVTAPIDFPEAQAELTVRKGTVEHQQSGSTLWVIVDGSAIVAPGDSVRTGVASDASINLFDQGVLHLAPESTMKLDESVWDAGNPDVFQGQVFLEAGNMWSRLFNFVSPDSDFEVRTSSTVATVRGTTFWVGAFPNNTSRVYVDEHTVEVRSLVGVLDVTDGEMVRLEREGRQSMLNFAPPPSGEDLAIIEKYRGWDRDYEQEVKAKHLVFARQARKIDPNSPLYGFQRFSERTRLALALNDEKRDELKTRFMTGRVLDAYIDSSARHDANRTKLLLQRARDIGDEKTATKPEVRRAMLYLDRAEPAQLSPEPLRDVELEPELNDAPLIPLYNLEGEAGAREPDVQEVQPLPTVQGTRQEVVDPSAVEPAVSAGSEPQPEPIFDRYLRSY